MRSVGEIAQLACVLEATAPKAGNVHPRCAFHNALWSDFVVSASVTRPVFDRATVCHVGATVLECVRVTRDATGTNTNLGIALLLAPLCAVLIDTPLRPGVAQVLRQLDDNDTAAVYEAIRVAAPGGLGRVAAHDVHYRPDTDLITAMRCVADRDAIARQYACGFADVFDVVSPCLVQAVLRGEPLDRAIVGVHLQLLAAAPDSLIRRKCGDADAHDVQWRATQVLDAGWPNTPAGLAAFDEFDAHLRDDGHRRNPGTSADMIAAGLFVAVRDGDIAEPFTWSESIEPELTCIV
jgi:triphosphoribosyl-dephospho-CoA synthase